MDPALGTQAASGLEVWLSANGALIQLVLYATQFAFWLAMIVFIGYAVATYKRWVNYQMGVGKSGQLRTGAVDSATSDASGDESFDASTSKAEVVSVEEFVD